MDKRISVIIPCYNSAHFLDEAIDSVLAQSHKNTEIIVIDDGSQDNIDDVARQYAGHIVYIKQDNQGVAAARNTGIAAATGDYIALLDADDLHYHDTLETLGNYLDSHPEIGVVCGDWMAFDASGDIGLVSEYSGKPRRPENFRWETVNYNLHTSTALVRSEVFETVGGFEEQLRNAGEDWMMWIVTARRYNMAYVDRPFARRRLHDQNVSNRRQDMAEGNRKAAKLLVDANYFEEYPPHVRARLLFFRFATSWRVEPRHRAVGYLWRAIWTDPRQFNYFVHRVVDAWRNRNRREQPEDYVR